MTADVGGGRLGNRLKDRAIPIDVIHVPIALGANRAGPEQGPAVLDEELRRILDFRGFPEILDRLSPPVTIDAPGLDETENAGPEVENAFHAAAIADVCVRLSSAVSESIADGRFPLVLGGDHSLSIGSLAGASTAGRIGAIWIDAHGDINTPQTSPSGNVRGMPLAASLGYGPEPLVNVGHRVDLAIDDLVYIGVRDLDPGERELLRQSPAMLFTMESVDTMGIDAVTEEAIRRLLERGVYGVHLSFDFDALDPSVFPATGVTVPGGLTYREARRCLTGLRASNLPILSADIVEFDPTLDGRPETARIAGRLVAALLGEELA
ncbi:arginase [soil metagenome]